MRDLLIILLSFLLLTVNWSHCAPDSSHHHMTDNTVVAGMAVSALPSVSATHMAQDGFCDSASALCDMADASPDHDFIAALTGIAGPLPLISGHHSPQPVSFIQRTDSRIYPRPLKTDTLLFSTPVTRHTILRL